MPHSSSVIAAATTLSQWGRERRRVWSDELLPVPPPVVALVELPDIFEDDSAVDVDVVEPEAAVLPPFAMASEAVVEEAFTPIEEVVEFVEPEPAAPSMFAVARARLNACAAIAGAMFVAATAWIENYADDIAYWTVRGAALASTLSVVIVIGIHRGQLFAQWDRVAAMVMAAAARPPEQHPQPAAPPDGTGRLTIASSTESAVVLVDGTPRGTAPVTLNLPPGAHRVLLRTASGSVERAVRIRAGESSEVSEAIYPGWIVLTTPVELTVSEGGHALKRDDRGWTMLPPGPHEILLENRALGVHEVRRIVVTPGDTTRLSFAPQSSTLSLTTNELAEVWIDGASFGKTPLVDQPIPLGVHDVRLRSASHERWIRVRATVQPVQVNVDLTAAR